MTYELAIKLRDSGFPQDNCLTYWGKVQFRANQPRRQRLRLIIPSMKNREKWKAPKVMVANPTLEELIEACGDRFTSLDYWNGYIPLWTAQFGNDSINKQSIKGDGQTPEEAVAKLWLALNKKESVNN